MSNHLAKERGKLLTGGNLRQNQIQSERPCRREEKKGQKKRAQRDNKQYNTQHVGGTM